MHLFRTLSRLISSLVGKRGLEAHQTGSSENDKNQIESKLPKTFIKDLHTRPPLLVQRVLYPNISMPHMAHVCLMSSAGSILENDRSEIRIDAGLNTCSSITTQAATKVHPNHEGHAYQYTNINLGRNAFLEYVPEQIIPFKSSKVQSGSQHKCKRRFIYDVYGNSFSGSNRFK